MTSQPTKQLKSNINNFNFTTNLSRRLCLKVGDRCHQARPGRFSELETECEDVSAADHEAAGRVIQLCYDGGERVDVTVRIWRCDVRLWGCSRS